MKEFSKEIIEIDGKEYTLFLNRKGIVAWEKFAKEENRKMLELEDKADKIINGENVEIKEDTNPFENLEDFDAEEGNDILSKSYRKLYWIMLYENHKLSITEVNDLYDKAKEEYGEVQLVQLATQMIKDANSNKVEKVTNSTKKLPALRPNEK